MAGGVAGIPPGAGAGLGIGAGAGIGIGGGLAAEGGATIGAGVGVSAAGAQIATIGAGALQGAAVGYAYSQGQPQPSPGGQSDPACQDPCGVPIKTPQQIASERGAELVKQFKQQGIGQQAGRSGGHGEPFKRAGAELIREANKLPKDDPLREAMKTQGRRLIEKGKSISHRGG